MMTKASRILVLLAALALGLVYVLPLWRIDLEAPQYPEGLGMVIQVNTIEGMKPHDLANINNLNHYIGMRAIEPESIPELKLMPVVVGVLMLLGVITAAIGRRALLHAWVAVFLLVAAAGLVDFWKWGYDYGHNLDEEHAIIKIPGMSYQPPLIGSKQLLNFRAHSWPGAGGWIAIVSCLIGVGVAVGERRRRGRGVRDVRVGATGNTRRTDERIAGVGATALLSVILSGGCAPPEPRPAELGVDVCTHCLMVVEDDRYVAEIVTLRGVVHVFDAVECMTAHLAAEIAPEDVHSLWVSDFSSPGELIRAEQAFYVQSAALPSPMGLGLTAFAGAEERDAAAASFAGRALDWDGVRRLVAGAWPDGGPPHGHGGHQSVQEPGGSAARGSVRVASSDRRFSTVGEAVAAATPHDTLWIGAGLYREPTVVVDRPLALVGEPGAVLDGEGARGLIEIRADSVSVRGLTFANTGISFTQDRSAVLVEGARFCAVEDNRFHDTFFGIYLASSGDCLLRGNDFAARAGRETRSGNGIHLWYSARVRIEDNRIRGHRDGIYFEFVEDSRVSGNESTGNLRYGLHFMFSDGCAYLSNRFAENGAGVAVMYTRDVLVSGNDFDRNRGSAAFGLLLKDITDSRIVDNRFRRNSAALYAEGANRIEVSGNEFVENGWAVQLMANSEATRFEQNDFVANSFDVSTNSRRTRGTFTGNYWDRYRGYDLDRDGTGDVPFRPVRLFALVVERNEPTLVLLRSFLVGLLDAAEQVLPVLTPANLVDDAPALTPRARARGRA